MEPAFAPPVTAAEQTHEIPMSAFALYAIGFVLVVAGVLYAEHLLHVPQTWVIVSALVLLGLGVMSAVSHTKRRDPPSEAPGP